MGIRFACHVCGKQLNIKRDLAGRRGVCPQCQSRFRIPMEDAAQSTPVEAVRVVQPEAASSTGQGGTAVMAEQKVATQVVVSSPSASEPAAQVVVTKDVVTKDVVTEADEAGGQQSVQEVVVPRSATGSILDQEPDATWYVRPPSGGQYGPASTVELQEWIAQGRVAASALLWRDGWPQWRDASEALPELSDKLPGAPVAAGHVTGSSGNLTLQVESADARAKGKKSGIALTGDTGIGAERRSRTMRRISLIAVLVAIAALLIAVLVYVINR